MAYITHMRDFGEQDFGQARREKKIVVHALQKKTGSLIAAGGCTAVLVRSFPVPDPGSAISTMGATSVRVVSFLTTKGAQRLRVWLRLSKLLPKSGLFPSCRRCPHSPKIFFLK